VWPSAIAELEPLVLGVPDHFEGFGGKDGRQLSWLVLIESSELLRTYRKRCSLMNENLSVRGLPGNMFFICNSNSMVSPSSSEYVLYSLLQDRGI
jgi:hypothetical protein